MSDEESNTGGDQVGPQRETVSTPVGPESIEGRVRHARQVIEEISKIVLAMKRHPYFDGEQKVGENHGEMIANIMLSYRHLEDARMRLGKVYQAKDGGTSVYKQ